jgi:hypothetical protein
MALIHDAPETIAGNVIPFDNNKFPHWISIQSCTETARGADLDSACPLTTSKKKLDLKKPQRLSLPGRPPDGLPCAAGSQQNGRLQIDNAAVAPVLS